MAFKKNEFCTVRRLMWANDFPYTPPDRKRRSFLVRQTGTGTWIQQASRRTRHV